jgi:hypothetical protein
VIRVTAWLVAAALHLGVPAALGLRWVYADAGLPAVPPRLIVEVWPIDWFNPLSLLQGATEPQVARFFGSSEVPRKTSLRLGCVRYQYSPRLSYTLLFRSGTVESMWLTEDGFIPYLCERALVGTVKVAPRPWYPSEAARLTSGCGCPTLRASTCEAP